MAATELAVLECAVVAPTCARQPMPLTAWCIGAWATFCGTPATDACEAVARSDEMATLTVIAGSEAGLSVSFTISGVFNYKFMIPLDNDFGANLALTLRRIDGDG
jgi:hypothetical protein